MKSKIVFEDEELIVIGKPAGIAVQSASVMQTDVVSELKNYLGTEDIGLVHRLDQPVEGLIVVGKNKKATAKLSAGLSDGSIKKSYKALAFDESGLWGAGEKFTLEDMMLKDPKTKRAVILKDIDSKKVAAGNRKGGRDRESGVKKAVLDCHILEIRSGIMLCDITLHTGRFHQIRAQLSNAGLPLLGDRKYAAPLCIQRSQSLGVKDVALCADRLSFVHPVTGKTLSFTMEPSFIKLYRTIPENSL